MQDFLRVQILSPHATIPERATKGSAGYDLRSARDIVIPAGGRAIVYTDIAIAVPPGCYARIAPLSGLAVKRGISTGAGVVDADYRGNIGVVLFNHSDRDYLVEKGHRIAQLILEQILTPDVVQVYALDTTERGTGGFGSTGL